MDAILSQDWTTIRGAAGVATFTQPEMGLVDLQAYQDVVTWLEVKEASNIGSTAIYYQTAPTKDDALFINLAVLSPAPVGVVTVTPFLKNATSLVSNTLSRWFRWQIGVTGGGAWDITFRLWLAANYVGDRRIASASGPVYAGGTAAAAVGTQSSGGLSWLYTLAAELRKQQPQGTFSDVPAPQGSQSTGLPTPGTGDF
jgi:hypothetical protein